MERDQRLSRHLKVYSSCVSCQLGKCKKEFRVFYRGSIPCDVLFVGEAAGEHELLFQEPFLGPAGKLLDEIISESIPDLSVCFTNTVVCPPQDSPHAKLRAPKKSEVSACSKRLQQFISIANPTHLVAVGNIAATALSKLGLHFTKIIHPAAILRQEERGALDYARSVTALSQLAQ